jgi:hypothetical protein
MKYVVGCILFIMMATSGFAAERKMFIALKAGGGGIQVNEQFAINELTSEQDIFSGSVIGGYNFDSGLVAELELSGAFSEDFFDSYDVSQVIVMLGYNFELAKKFTFVPKAGISSWGLDTFESSLFNIFGSDEEHSYDGTDPIWSLEGEYFWTDMVQVNLSYTQGNYGFGDLDSLRFGVEFDF